MRDELIPSNEEIYGLAEKIFGQGIRRPGYPADRWAEEFCLDYFRRLGMENVHAEPVEVPCWRPHGYSLRVSRSDADVPAAIDVPCFPLPHSAPTAGVEGPLAVFDEESPEGVSGAIAFQRLEMGRLPYDAVANVETWRFDPEGTLAGHMQTLPFARQRQQMMEPIVAAGGLAYVGALGGYPGNPCEYYVPYHGVLYPIPGVWVSGSDGERLARMLEAGPLRARIAVDADIRPVQTANVMGELPGSDDELVIVGSHHDAPWASAVEDTSGVALVLAQAMYWSRLPREKRPHRMLCHLNTGHMVGARGATAFRETHQADLERTVLEVHLEHAAAECVEVDGALTATGLPEPRWWFTTRIPQLEASVKEAIEVEGLVRSLILPPTAFGEFPPTDGSRFFLAGVPLVSFLAAPFYLFDSNDTLDKVDRGNLAAITRAVVRIIESTRGESARSMREAERR